MYMYMYVYIYIYIYIFICVCVCVCVCMCVCVCVWVGGWVCSYSMLFVGAGVGFYDTLRRHFGLWDKL